MWVRDVSTNGNVCFREAQRAATDVIVVYRLRCFCLVASFRSFRRSSFFVRRSSFVRSFVRLFVRSFVRSIVRSFVRRSSFVASLTPLTHTQCRHVSQHAHANTQHTARTSHVARDVVGTCSVCLYLRSFFVVPSFGRSVVQSCSRPVVPSLVRCCIVVLPPFRRSFVPSFFVCTRVL